MTQHILSIHAHPDDAEMLCAGTLALLAKAGHRVTIVTMTPGDCGSMIHGPDEIATMRRAEGANAAALIGAEYLCAEFRDMGVFNDDAGRRKVTELLRRVNPTIVLTSSPADYHCDHEATSILVRDACFAVSCPNYKSGDAPAMAAIPHLYFMDSIEGRDREGKPVPADFGVDVGETFQTKKDMLAAHTSQREWLQQQHGMDDYIASMETWTRARGGNFCVPYAEGFRQYKHHPYPTTPLLQELVGKKLVR